MPKSIVSQPQLALRAALFLAALAVSLAALPAAAQDGAFNANDCMEVRCETNSVVNRCDNPVNYAYCKIKQGQRGCLYEFSRRIEPGQSGLSLCQSEHQYAFTACLAPHKPVSVSPTRRQCIPDPNDPAVKKIGEPCDSEWESNIPGLVCDGEWTYVVPPDESPASAAQTLTADEREWKERQEAEKAEAEKRAREKECSQILNSCETACNDICEDPETCAPGTDAMDCGYEKDEAAALRAEHRQARKEQQERESDNLSAASRETPPTQTATERLLGAELDPFAADENGWTHMHWAAAGDDGEAIRRLLELGASVDPIDRADNSELSADGHRRAALLGLNMEDWKNTGDTPLIIAAWFGMRGSASILIASGANVNAKNNRNGTPLHSSAWENTYDVARLLLENGADVNVKRNDGGTPLHLATWKNASDVARLLLENGAEINAKNDKGETPMDFAIYKKHAEMKSFLRRNGGRCNKFC